LKSAIWRFLTSHLRLRQLPSPSQGAGDTPFLLIHIDKTACSSVYKALVPPTRSSEAEGGNIHRPGKHWTAQQWKNRLGPKEFHKCFKFAIVRNPFDRLRSKYQFSRHIKTEPFRDPFNRYCQTMSFSEWVIFLSEQNHKPLRSQAEYLCGSSPKELLVDYIGRYETLERDFQHICRLLGYPTSTTLPHLNKSPATTTDYRLFYDDASKSVVEAWYRDDLDLLDYRF